MGPPESAAALAAKYPNLVVAGSTQDPGHATALRLIRPDGYVGFAGSAKEQARADAYLAALAAG
jgi:hypothetical protein